MKIVEYKLRVLVRGHGKTAPLFIIDGGYWPIGDTLIGIADPNADLPNDVPVLTESELKDRVASIDVIAPIPWITPSTKEQKEMLAEAWIKEKKKEHG